MQGLGVRRFSQSTIDSFVFHIQNHSSIRKSPSDVEKLASEFAKQHSVDTQTIARQMLVLYIADQIGKGTVQRQLDSFEKAITQREPELTKITGLTHEQFSRLLAVRQRLISQWFKNEPFSVPHTSTIAWP